MLILSAMEFITIPANERIHTCEGLFFSTLGTLNINDKYRNFSRKYDIFHTTSFIKIHIPKLYTEFHLPGQW